MARKSKAQKTPAKQAQLEMMLKFRDRRHIDRKKQASKRACRGKIAV